MALTGRFMFRRSFLGRIVLVVEEDVKAAWPLRKTQTRQRWRDANLMDLPAPEMRPLIDLRHKPRVDLARYYYTPAAAPPVTERSEAEIPPRGAVTPVDSESRPNSH
jgi:hypothetical protein